MGINYSTSPSNFEELCDSVRGQVERSREYKMMGKEMPPSECVAITAESMLALVDRMEAMVTTLQNQARLFNQIEDMFRFVFHQLGIDLDNLPNGL